MTDAEAHDVRAILEALKRCEDELKRSPEPRK